MYQPADIVGVRVVSSRPAGYRWLGEYHYETLRSVRFSYYGWALSLPKRGVLQVPENEFGSRFVAAPWAIEWAKGLPNADQFDSGLDSNGVPTS